MNASTHESPVPIHVPTVSTPARAFAATLLALGVLVTPAVLVAGNTTSVVAVAQPAAERPGCALCWRPADKSQATTSPASTHRTGSTT